jgi:hypothetical protein
MDRLPEDVAARTLLDLDGRLVPFGSLYEAQPAVLVFLRHFG